MGKYVDEAGLTTLKSMMDETYVQTVNSTGPDDDGNVNVSVPAAGYKSATLTSALNLPAGTNTTVLSLTLEPGYLWHIVGFVSAKPTASSESGVSVLIREDSAIRARQSTYFNGSYSRSLNISCFIDRTSATSDVACIMQVNPVAESNTAEWGSHATLWAVQVPGAYKIS